MKLTEAEKLAIQKGEALRTMEDGIEMITVRADVYQQTRNVMYDDGPLSEEERLSALKSAAKRAGWNDPEMDIYDQDV